MSMGRIATGYDNLADLEAAIYNVLKEVLEKKIIFYFNTEFIELCCRKVRSSEFEVYKALSSLIHRKYIVPGTSLTKEKVLANPTRKQMYVNVQDTPGIHIRELCTAVNKRIGIILAHLEVLETFGFIRTKKFSNFKITLLFVKDFPEDYDIYFLITKNESARRLLQLLTHQQLTISELSSSLGLHYSTVQYHLKRLERLDLVIRMVGDHITKFIFNKAKLASFTEFSEVYLEK